jgi:hypothetical protein
LDGLQFERPSREPKAARDSSTGLWLGSADGDPLFVGIFSTTVALASTIADLAGMDATPMSKLESNATDVVLKIFTFCSFLPFRIVRRI